MYDGRTTVVIDDKLAYEDLMPVLWRPLDEPVSDMTAKRLAESNLRVLQACDALEEHGKTEKPDDESPHSADIMRLDFKLNLLLDLVGQLIAASQPRARPLPIRFNAMGASWKPVEPLAVGANGILEVTLKELIVQPLQLPAQVVSGAARDETRVRFLALSETVADHIEKLVFRRHRRKIAGSRQQRA
jgi:hypothetical protein